MFLIYIFLFTYFIQNQIFTMDALYQYEQQQHDQLIFLAKQINQFIEKNDDTQLQYTINRLLSLFPSYIPENQCDIKKYIPIYMKFYKEEYYNYKKNLKSNQHTDNSQYSTNLSYTIENNDQKEEQIIIIQEEKEIIKQYNNKKQINKEKVIQQYDTQYEQNITIDLEITNNINNKTKSLWNTIKNLFNSNNKTNYEQLD